MNIESKRIKSHTILIMQSKGKESKLLEDRRLELSFSFFTRSHLLYFYNFANSAFQHLFQIPIGPTMAYKVPTRNSYSKHSNLHLQNCI
ncbi:hypothetical protein QL285_033846 [Trifolium repens]|nr:hypothetical protein QL285_033846 [Trifolium repens]